MNDILYFFQLPESDLLGMNIQLSVTQYTGYTSLYIVEKKDFWNSFLSWWNGLQLVIQIYIISGYEYLEKFVFSLAFRSRGPSLMYLIYCILLANYYILLYSQKIQNENAIDFYQYLTHLKYKLKIEYIICSQNNERNFEKFIFLYYQLQLLDIEIRTFKEINASL